MPGVCPGVEHLKDGSIRQLLFSPANIRVGRKALARTNTLAYYKNLEITNISIKLECLSLETFSA
jgi:hypothetical protein